MSDKDFIVKNGLVVNNFFTVNSTAVLIGNTTSNATVNSTIYTGTSNNTLFVGTVAAANVVSNAQLIANLALYQTLAGEQANVAKLYANSAQYLGAPGSAIIYTDYARYSQPGTFANNITINGNVVFANVNQISGNPNYMVVVGNATFQNSVSITGSYLNTTSNSVSFGTAVTILPSGNVGIGTDTPTNKLSVSGNVGISQSLIVTNTVSFSNTLAVTGSATFSNAVTVANLTSSTNSTVFGTAAVILPSGNVGIGNTTPADRLSVTGNVAVSNTIKVGTATINATNYSQTANNALFLGGVIASDYVTTSATTGLLSSYFRKDSGNQDVSANSIFNANVEIRSSRLVINATSTIVANGGIGAAGQALFSNGTSIYWGPLGSGSFAAPGANTQMIYNDQGSLAAVSGLRFINTSNTIVVGNTTVNSSVNSTAFSGTANNSLSLGGSLAADYSKKADTINLGTTAVSINRSSGALTLADVTVDNANNSAFLGTISAASYQLNSTLAANVATMTAGNTAFVGAVAAADMASKSYVTGAVSAKADITGTTPITVSNSSGGSAGITLAATSDTGIGVSGTSNSNYGVYGVSNSSYGVYGVATSNNGVYGVSNTRTGVIGISKFGIGVAGIANSNIGGNFISNTGTGIVVVSNTGIVATFSNNTTTFAGIYANGNMGIANTTPGSKLTVTGLIESTLGGVKFPDGSIQTAASGGGGYYKGNAGAVGIAGNKGNLFRINSNSMSNNITISAGENALTVGPLTIETGNSFIIETGGRAVII